MNKIYKVVWSKVKNCYVVVSEIAKNVITGAVKSAKVGSSVASGLAMGALMAFVITGNAMAADMTINADNKIGLTDAQVDWAVIGQSDFAVDGKLTINSNANSISAFGHTDNSEAKMTVTANGLEATTVNGTAVFVAGDHKNANLTINAGEGDVKITGTGEAHGIAVKSQGGSATINAADIKVTATENGVYAREDGAAITLNGANVTVESTNKGEQAAHKGHAVYVDKNAQVKIDATGDVTLKAADGKYAIGINGGEDLVKDAVVTVKAGNNVDIDGQVFARQEATVNIEGTNVTVDTDSKDAISVSGGTVNVTADDIKLTSKQNDGVQVVEGTVKLQANDVAIDAGNWGVKATLDKGGNIDVTADTIKVTGKNGGIYNEGKNGVVLNADNGVEVTGKVYVNYGGSVNVDAGVGDVTINGDVDAWHGTTVDISGNNVTLNSTVADAIQGCATTVTITAKENIIIDADVKDGIESCASTVSLNAKNVEITSDGAWGVVGTGDAGTDIDINAETIKIAGQAGAIRNLAASDVTITATDKVEVTGQVENNFGGTVSIKGNNVTLSNDGADTVKSIGGTINIEAAKDLTITAVEGEKAINATGKDSLVTLSAKNSIDITGAVHGDSLNNARVKIGDENTGNITITSSQGQGEYASTEGVVRNVDIVSNGTVRIEGTGNLSGVGAGATSEMRAQTTNSIKAEEIEIVSKGGYGVYVNDHGYHTVGTRIHADLEAENISIDSYKSGIHVMNGGVAEITGFENLNVIAGDRGISGEFGNITVTGGNVVVESGEEGIQSLLGGELKFETEFFKVDSGLEAIKLTGKSNLNIDSDVTQITGDVLLESNSQYGDPSLIVAFNGEDSILKGNVYTAVGANTTLSFAEGATWETDDKSSVTNLNVDGANIIINNAQAESITVGTLTGTSMHVDIASVAAQQMRAAGNSTLSGVITVDEIGDSDEDGEKDNVRVSVTTSGVNMNAANAKDYKDIVRVGNDVDGYKGIVGEIDAKNTYISGDVKFEDDGDGGFKVVSTTLNGDVNVTGTINGVDVTNAAGLERNAESKSYQTTTIEGKTTIDSMGRVYTNHVFADQAIVVGDHSTLDRTGLYVGKNFKVDKETGDVEAGKVNGAEISDYMFNGVVLDKDGDVFAKDVMATGGITAIGNITSLQGVKAAGGKFVVDGATGDVTTTGDVKAGGVSLKQTADKVAEVEAGYKAADTNLQTQIDEVKSQNSLNDRVNNVQNTQIAQIQSKNNEQDRVLADHEDRIDNLEGTVADHEGRIENLEGAVSDLNGAIGDVEAGYKAADDALKAEVEAGYKAADAELQASIDKEVADREAAVKAEAEAREAAVKAEAEARQEADAKLKEAMTSEVGRLDNRIDKVDAKIDKVGAMAAAMASLKTMGYDPEAPTEIAVGVGQYRNETGLAIGAFHYPNKNFMLNFSLSTAGDEVMGGIGATWKIGRKR